MSWDERVVAWITFDVDGSLSFTPKGLIARPPRAGMVVREFHSHPQRAREFYPNDKCFTWRETGKVIQEFPITHPRYSLNHRAISCSNESVNDTRSHLAHDIIRDVTRALRGHTKSKAILTPLLRYDVVRIKGEVSREL